MTTVDALATIGEAAVGHGGERTLNVVVPAQSARLGAPGKRDGPEAPRQGRRSAKMGAGAGLMVPSF